MVAEVEVLVHVDDVVDSILVFFAQCVEYLHLHKRLVVKPATNRLSCTCCFLKKTSNKSVLGTQSDKST